PHRPRAEAAHASARQLVDLSVERGRVELTGGVLAERRHRADLESLLALARQLAVHGAEAPDLARAEVPVEVAPPRGGHRLAPIDVAARDGAAAAVVLVGDDREDELASAARPLPGGVAWASLLHPSP